MKKNLTIIASAVLALGMLFVTGCKPSTSGVGTEDVANWSGVDNYIGQDSTNQAQYEGILQIKADKAIDWWVITDRKGIVIQPDSIHPFDTKDKKEEKLSNLDYKSEIAQDKVINVHLSNTLNGHDKDVILWTYQPGQDKNQTYRGLIKVKADMGRLVKASGAKQVTMPVTTLLMSCNETNKDKATKKGDNNIETKNIPGTEKKGMQTGSGSGNYNITEIWPIKRESGTDNDIEGGVYKAVGDFHMEGLDIKEGTSLEVIFPADGDAFFLATKQPNRYNVGDTQSDVTLTTETAKKANDYLWCFKTQFNNSKFSKTPVWAVSSLGKYRYDASQNKIFNSKNNEVRYSNDPAYFIYGSDLVEAADEK